MTQGAHQNDVFRQDDVFRPSPDLVARKIEDEIILIPVTNEALDAEDAIFSLNETGYEIWKKMEKGMSIGQISDELAAVYNAPRKEIEKDVKGIIAALLARHIIIQSKD